MAHGSVTHWIAELRDGQASLAQQQLWNRYFYRLVALARKKLDGGNRRAEDEEDVALSALASFFGAVGHGRYPDLSDRTQLWPLLVKITASKSMNQLKRQRALKRGGGKVRGELAIDSANQDVRALEHLVGDEPSPQFMAQVSEQCERLIETLPDDLLRRIVELKLQGFTSVEIATRLDVVERTVERKLAIIRKIWTKELAS
jgi:DNA-directed RNA polymerase specialized sigma24 family protein